MDRVGRSKPLVLLVEDEPDVAEGLTGFLRYAGFEVIHAEDGLRAFEHFSRAQPDVVLLDLMLPGLTGLEVLRVLRGEHATPVIVLTARVTERDILRGFELGADDYVTKPFRSREVVARIEAVLRRAGSYKSSVLRGGDGLELDLETRRVRLGLDGLELTAGEFELLAALLAAPGRVFTRLELLEVIGSLEAGSLERAVDTHVKNLRRKLGEHHRLETVFGVGYRYATN
jgi:DNA-binding response OmpR family regulator